MDNFFAIRLRQCLPHILPDAVDELALLIEQLLDASKPTLSDRNQAMVHVLQAFASGVLRDDELRVLSETAPALVRELSTKMACSVSRLVYRAAHGGIPATELFEALVGKPQDMPALVAARGAGVDSQAGLMGCLIEMAREEMERALVMSDLRADYPADRQLAALFDGHTLRTKALLAGAAAIMGALL